MPMDYVDLYLRRPPGSTVAKPTVAAVAGGGPSPASLGQQLDSLVGGTLAAQEMQGRLEDATARVDAVDTKVASLARLLKLSQSIQAERERELASSGAELRARLVRQEQETQQLRERLEALAARDAAKETQVATLERRLTEVCEEHQAALRQQAAELRAEMAAAAAEQQEKAQRLVAAAVAAERETARAELGDTQQWAARNLQRLKQHVEAAAERTAPLEERVERLASRVNKMQQQSEREYERLCALLQQKTREADAAYELLEKEMESVRQVSEQHAVLRSQHLEAGLVRPSASTAATASASPL